VEAKKLGGDSLVHVIEEIRDTQRQKVQDIQEVNKRVDEHHDEITQLKNAFPSTDIEGHRRYHQLIIDNTEAKRALATAIKEKTISGLIWGFIVWLASEAWTHLPKIWGG